MQAEGKAERMIIALLEQPTLERAASSVGISDVTLWRWLKKPEFRDAYQKARRDAFSRSIGRLQFATSAAVSCLLRILADPNAPAASRVRAADCVLNYAAKALELEDIETRLSRLEQHSEGTES